MIVIVIRAGIQTIRRVTRLGALEVLLSLLESEPDFDFARLSELIKEVIDDAISLLSDIRHRMDSELIEETEPVSIIGKTFEGSRTGIRLSVFRRNDLFPNRMEYSLPGTLLVCQPC